MSVQEFKVGDVVACPHCGKEFKIKNLIDDYDNYFMHTLDCLGWFPKGR